jgi:ABC-type uncharacterized transport system involved in gliding motility auxiliary subunit
MPDKKKRNRIWSYGSNSVVSTLFFLGILVFIALIAEEHPWRVDLTESGRYTLAEQTRNILKTLDQPVEIKAFFPTSSPQEMQARELLETYRYFNKKISYEFIDPDRQPDVARRYEIRNYGTLVLEGYGKKQSIQNIDEENLTNAFLKLTTKEQKKIYFLTGHGEHSSQLEDKNGYAHARSALEKDNYAVADLNLMQKNEVPRDAAMVIIGGPEKPVFPEEVKRLNTYLNEGGKVFVLLDPYRDGGLRDFLKAHGIELKDDIIVDESVGIFGGNYLMPLAAKYGHHKITQNFNIATFYPEARSVRIMNPLPKGVEVEALASTSQDAWAETNLKLLEEQHKVGFDEKEDLSGPVPLAVAAEIDPREFNAEGAGGSSAGDREEKKNDDTGKGAAKGYLLVSGDSDFVANSYFGLSGNADLFLNMVNFLAGDENLITIERKESQGRPLLLTQNQFYLLVWMVLVVVPLIVILSGLVVYRVRRSQR